MCLRTVAEQDHESRQHRQGLHTETEILPSLVSGEEGDTQQRKHHHLHQPVVGQQEGFQSYGKEDTDEIRVAVMSRDHIKHLLVEHKHIIEGSIDGR